MKKVKKSLAFLLAFVMVFTAIGVQMPVTVQAATKIALSCTMKTVAVGGTYTVSVEGVNDKKATYAWSSSNKKVATVSKSGVVTGVAEGNATIKCKITMSDESTKTLSCKVTVKKQKAATSVKISNADLGTINAHTIEVGETFDFNRTIVPSSSNDKTYWYVLNEDYAEVDTNGIVTAKKEGITMLIARSGIDRVDAESMTNKVVDYIHLNIVPAAPEWEEPDADTEARLEEIRDAYIGDYVTFGTYEQDNRTGNGTEAIEWQVLDKKDGKVLLISKYALDCKPYNEQEREVTWETCTLRRWLNDEFYNTAFTSIEQQYIAESYIFNEDNQTYYTDAGEHTYDNVFLLSLDEVDAYFADDIARKTEMTQYTKANGGDPNRKGNTYGRWWLRSPGSSSDSAAVVNNDGDVSRIGDYVDFLYDVVRPALWIEVE